MRYKGREKERGEREIRDSRDRREKREEMNFISVDEEGQTKSNSGSSFFSFPNSNDEELGVASLVLMWLRATVFHLEKRKERPYLMVIVISWSATLPQQLAMHTDAGLLPYARVGIGKL